MTEFSRPINKLRTIIDRSYKSNAAYEIQQFPEVLPLDNPEITILSDIRNIFTVIIPQKTYGIQRRDPTGAKHSDFYAADLASLQNLLLNNRDAVIKANWPLDPEAFIRRVAKKRAKPYSEIEVVIGKAFANPQFMDEEPPLS